MLFKLLGLHGGRGVVRYGASSALEHRKACCRLELRNTQNLPRHTAHRVSSSMSSRFMFTLLQGRVDISAQDAGCFVLDAKARSSMLGRPCVRRRRQYGNRCKTQGCPRLSSPVAPRSSLRSTIGWLPNGRGQSHIRLLLPTHRLYE